MKKFIIISLIGFSAWNYFHKTLDVSYNATSASVAVPDQGNEINYQKPTQTFRCDGRQHCSQMNSRAEAVFFINNCPNTKMDGDRDGIPCENDSRF